MRTVEPSAVVLSKQREPRSAVCSVQHEVPFLLQVASLSTNTVDDLRARLKDTTASFRDVLTLRQENLKVHQGRRQLFSAAPESRAFPSAAPPGAPGCGACPRACWV